ncbi:ABC transporter permease [Streptomyces sp. NBC_00448]|uniref:ABC transporter permease n=1 Tax=Streptomyces sp. NBC_00448 TaxID=2903652 RepID=UPI002E1EBC11
MSSASPAVSGDPLLSADGGGPRPRFTDLVAAEWIKLRSLRSTYWVLASCVVVAVVVNLNAVRSDFTYIDHPPPPMPGRGPVTYDPIFHGLNQISADLVMLAAAVVGAITVFGEYATGMVRTTFAAVPDRRAVALAKLVVVTAVTLVMGTTVSTVSFFGSNAMLASRHVGLSITDPGCVRCVAAYALIAPVCALLGMALGAVFRHATASVVAVVALLFLVPLLFGGDRYKLLRQIGNTLPGDAQSRLVANPAAPIDFGKYPASVHGSWIALAAWAVVSGVVAVVVIRRRDV